MAFEGVSKDQVRDYWTPRLSAWIKNDAKAKEYANLFAEHHIMDTHTLSKVEPQALKDLGVSLGHRSLIYAGARDSALYEQKRRTRRNWFGNLGLDFHGMGEEFCSRKFWLGALGEFLASGIFVFILLEIIVGSGTLPGVATITGTSQDVQRQYLPIMRYLSIAIGAGFAFALTSWLFADISGGHITPAISFAYMWSTLITPLRFIVYVFAQGIGAMIGAGFVNTVNLDLFVDANGGENIVQTGYSGGSATGIEVLTTYILCTVALSLTEDLRPRKERWFGHLVLGFVVLCVYLIALPMDGASMNPTRSFASSALRRSWAAHWVWWVGPGLGAMIAAIFYEIFLREKPINERQPILHTGYEKVGERIST